jgi:hypothetical protein
MQFDVNQELLRNWITKKGIIIKKKIIGNQFNQKKRKC